VGEKGSRREKRERLNHRVWSTEKYSWQQDDPGMGRDGVTARESEVRGQNCKTDKPIRVSEFHESWITALSETIRSFLTSQSAIVNPDP
jgi:hypothetical protein